MYAVMRHLPLGALRAFEAAARAGSFRAAGEELGISASAVSHAIRKLEDMIGADLFERAGRTVRLNPPGEALLRHVATAFDEVRHGLETVGSRSGNLLRLHCAPSMAAQWLMPRLRRLMALYPDLDVRLSASTDYPRFVNDDCDADICYGPPRQEGLFVLPLGEETVTPLCAPDLAQHIKEVADLLRHKLIESEHKRVRWGGWFAANGMTAPSPRGSRFDRSFSGDCCCCRWAGGHARIDPLSRARISARRSRGAIGRGGSGCAVYRPLFGIPAASQAAPGRSHVCAMDGGGVGTARAGVLASYRPIQPARNLAPAI